MTRINKVWHTREVDVKSNTNVIGKSEQPYRKEDEQYQYIIHMKTSTNMLAKKFMGVRFEKVCTVGSQRKMLSSDSLDTKKKKIF